MQEPTIYVSGLYSGPSPSAGLGVARSLRAAFPAARLVGVDYWAGSSGLHHEAFDATWLKPSWDLIEAELFAAEIAAELAKGHLWLPTLDLEVAWLAEALPPHPRLLSPKSAALAPTTKPVIAVSELLPFARPQTLGADASDDEMYEFCRRQSWRVWLKGPYHEAVAVTSWRHFETVRAGMRARWRTDALSLQAHVRGHEESVCLAAVDGVLVDAVHMTKRVITPEGKTWAGRIDDVPASILEPVRRAVQALGWTGGAEIELLRDADDRLWINEWNPRFPAWVHGATVAGRNLPAALVAKSLGLAPPAGVPSPAPEFTRVVVEIPARADLPLPVPPDPEHGQLGAAGKYGAALASVVPRLAKAAAVDAASPFSAVSPETRADLDALRLDDLATPTRVLLPRTMAAAFGRAEAIARSGAIRPAYSVKTSPDPEYLGAAKNAGMLAECISMLEVRRALASGYQASEIILNGPGKWWPLTEAPVDGLRAVFCDSREELQRLTRSGRRDGIWGVRLKLPGFSSRFGVSVEEPDELDAVAALIAAFPRERRFGVHVHLASTLIGTGHWLDAVDAAIAWAALLEAASGRPVAALDLGGGFHPNDLDKLPFADIAAFARERLPGLEEIYAEPGRAVTQQTMAVVTSILDVRRKDGAVFEVVVDACIAELPLAAVHPHRTFLARGGTLTPLARGNCRVLGRICMEDDVVAAGLALSDDVREGDRLIICDAGAYDRSMSYDFGRGGYR